LPGVDDGCESMEESLALARLLVADGMTHVVATPHCHRQFHWLRAEILPRVARLNDAFATAEIPLAVLPGSEIQVVDSAEYRREFDAGLYCHLGDGDAFTLLEFSWHSDRYIPDAAELIGWLRSHGMTPIVAHPERHEYFSDEPDRLVALVEAGAWLQLTVDSLLGNHGPRAEASGEKILREHREIVLATDSHHLRRWSGLSPGFAWVESRLGRGRVDDLKARAAGILSRLLERRRDQRERMNANVN
jgi:protein-tyrosine phosphatase